MVDIQTIGVLVTAASVSVAAVYYVINLRNTRKTHELQVTMQVLALFSNKDFWDELDELLDREWKSLEEYHEKYGKGMSTGHVVFITFEELGVLIKRKLISPSVPWDLYGTFTLMLWEKYKPVVLEYRESVPDAAIWTEYLVNEVRRYSVEHPDSQVLPKTG